MDKKINFQKADKFKITVFSVSIFIALVALGNWIATSFGNFDSHVQEVFYKGMDISFFRGWTAYTVLDGYIAVLAYAFPTALLIFECLMKWLKINKPNLWVSQHYKVITNWAVALCCVVFAVFSTVFLASYSLFDQGFGVGFDVEFLTGREYIIPIYIVSILIESTVFGLQIYYYHNRWAKKDDFLVSKPWRPALTALLFMLYVYIPNLILKNGMGRPYWYNVHFTDGLNRKVNVENGIKGPLERIREIYGENSSYWTNYLNNSKINYGWNGNAGLDHQAWMLQPWPTQEQDIKWFDMGRGFFNKDGKLYDNVCKEQAFPSGHMNATILCLIVMALWFHGSSKSKKTNTLKLVVTIIGFTYLIDMVFALQVSSSHWWSDTMFSMAFAPLGYIAAYYTVNPIMNKLNKTYNVSNW